MLDEQAVLWVRRDDWNFTADDSQLSEVRRQVSCLTLCRMRRWQTNMRIPMPGRERRGNFTSARAVYLSYGICESEGALNMNQDLSGPRALCTVCCFACLVLCCVFRVHRSVSDERARTQRGRQSHVDTHPRCVRCLDWFEEL